MYENARADSRQTAGVSGERNLMKMRWERERDCGIILAEQIGSYGGYGIGFNL